MKNNDIGVYLIDDSDATNELNKYYLDECSLTTKITVFLNAERAIESLNNSTEKNWPSLIILDLKMPGFDGFDFLSQYEKIDKKLKSKTKVYVSSSTENEADFDRLKAFKFTTGFLFKPLSTERMDEILISINDD